MRFKHKPISTKQYPKSGERRLRTEFLFFPMTLKALSGDVVTRWLEKAIWTEEFMKGEAMREDTWEPIHWVDIQKEEL